MPNPEHPERAEDYDDDVQRAEDFGTNEPDDQLGRARPKQGGGGGGREGDTDRSSEGVGTTRPDQGGGGGGREGGGH
jgi:hypothetical protein